MCQICGKCQSFTADDHFPIIGSCEFKKVYVAKYALCNIDKFKRRK